MDNLTPLTSALRLHAVEGVVYLDRPVDIRRMVSATLRGFAGHRLREHDPEACDRWFKPRDPNQPAACVFQNLEREFFVGESFRFRIISFDSGLELLPALQQAIEAGRGIPFGGKGACLQYVEWDETVRLGFEGYEDDTNDIRLVMATPLQLRVAKRTVPENELNLAHLVRACASRLNSLSAAYGNSTILDHLPYLAEAAFAQELDARVRYVAPRRWSTTQDQGISLSGLVGHLDYKNVHHAVIDLLYTANVLHIGRHTGEGCGRVIAIPSRDFHDAGPADDNW